MPFLPGTIRICLSEDSCHAQMDDHFRKSHQGRRVNCDLCDQEVAVGLLWSHLELQHDVYRLFALIEALEPTQREPREFDAKYNIGTQYVVFRYQRAQAADGTRTQFNDTSASATRRIG